MGLDIIVPKFVALIIPGLSLVAILWSIARPDRRVWPPKTFGSVQSVVGWGGTFAFFAAVMVLGISDWGTAPVPHWLRYSIGPLLILVGNVSVWSEVIGFGADQTMGREGQLKTDGLYRYSRNPQYVADIAILVGWALLSASIATLPGIIGGIVVLLTCPFSEERWLEERYGAAYVRYREKVRRYF